MTTFKFTPSQQGPFQFQPVLDGNAYNCIVTWNLFGQRYYVNCYDLAGNLVFALPMVGSPDPVQATAAATASGEATVSMAVPAGLRPGRAVEFTLAGFAPADYNGTVLATVNDAVSISFPVTTNPPPASTLGTVDAPINLAAGYFKTSTLVFRESSQMFEVTP